MRKNILNIFTLAIIGIAIVGCKNKTEETATIEAETAMATIQDAVTYAVNIEKSIIEWQGFKPTGTHKGTIAITNGGFTVGDDGINGGSFVFDMNSIEESEDNARLIGHLKSADFFEVETFPTATFEITGLEELEGKTILSGNLTLKDVTNSVAFPVTVSNDNDSLTVSSEVFTIDRSKWNVRYGSKSFFDDLKDKFINDDIELKITIKANKS